MATADCTITTDAATAATGSLAGPQRRRKSEVRPDALRLIFASMFDRPGMEFAEMLNRVFSMHFRTEYRTVDDPCMIMDICDAEAVPFENVAYVAYDTKARKLFRVVRGGDDAPYQKIVIGPQVMRHGKPDRDRICSVIQRLLNLYYRNSSP